MHFFTKKYLPLALGLAVFSASAFAQCNPNLSPAATQTRPKLEGRMVYHAYTSYGDGSSNLYLYDFLKRNKPIKLNSAAWGIADPMNAHFSPDGKRIVFMGKYQGYWHIFVWKIGSSTTPTNLTYAMGTTLRNEDPKWSPDGKKIVFKHESDIKIINLAYGNNDFIGISSIVSLTNNRWVNEDSMPYFSGDGKYIVFARGTNSGSDIYRSEVDPSSGMLVTPPTAFAATPKVSDYYPIVGGLSTYFFTRWNSAVSRTDQLYMKDPNISDNPVELKLNYCYSNNSDAAPVNRNLLIFSSTLNTPYYNLYIGDIGTGAVWQLNDIGVNASTQEKLGASYSEMR